MIRELLARVRFALRDEWTNAYAAETEAIRRQLDTKPTLTLDWRV